MVNIVADVSKLIMTNIQINRRLVELVSLVLKINWWLWGPSRFICWYQRFLNALRLRTSRRRSANCRHFSLNLLSYNYDTLFGKTASNASSLSSLYRIILIYSVYLCVIWIYLFISWLPHAVTKIEIIIISWPCNFTESLNSLIASLISAFINRFITIERWEIITKWNHLSHV